MTACPFCPGAPAPDLARDRPGARIVPRAACAAHRAEARLADGAAAGPVAAGNEGSGLNFVLNPVTVAGRRAWLDFAMGGCAVLEEVFPSETFAEFLVQHRPDLVDYLEELRERPALVEALRTLAGGKMPDMELVVELASLLERGHRAQAAFAMSAAVKAELGRRGLQAPRSAEEAVEVHDAAYRAQAPIDRPTVEFVELLESAIRRRFAHRAGSR